ncbi:cation:proton antiporter subunit C [Planctobacterium marinum]|uniref:Na+/H+ antiporter subunit C n=1 Tax=Planctobacterium marinum TaxID=1631968 RepID=A0AA48KPC3_9ALTE|nr:Na+/H+ antiporter subunit C [Planctobacterium marinum]
MTFDSDFLQMFYGLFNYWIVVALMMCGLYVVITDGNLIKKVVGLTILQTSVFILYISMANIAGATAPIEVPEGAVYSNPLPHVLILTAIVVSISTTALALALIVRIKRAYHTVEEDVIQRWDVKKYRNEKRGRGHHE